MAGIKQNVGKFQISRDNYLRPFQKKTLCEKSQPQKDNVSPLYEVPRVVKLSETESRMVVAGAGERKELLLMGIESQFYKMKTVLEMEGGGGSTTL